MTKKSWRVWSWICLGMVALCLGLVVAIVKTDGSLLSLGIMSVNVLLWGCLTIFCDKQIKEQEK